MNKHTLVPESASRQAAPREVLCRLSNRALKLTVLCGQVAALLLLVGCAREKLFQSNFDATPVDPPQAPPNDQQVGVARMEGDLVVIAPPVLPSGKWVQMRRASPDTSPASFQGNLAALRGDGRYTFSATVFMESGAGIATIQFERLEQPLQNTANFLHLDLMPSNTVRIDDFVTTDLTFPRGKPFIVQVTLDIDEASSARIVLSGDGASGTVDHDIVPPNRAMARDFGAVRLAMAFPHLGTLKATNIAVTRKN